MRSALRMLRLAAYMAAFFVSAPSSAIDSVTVATLPGSPAQGDRVWVIDATGPGDDPANWICDQVGTPNETLQCAWTGSAWVAFVKGGASEGLPPDPEILIDSIQVGFDDSVAGLGETTVQGALEALSAVAPGSDPNAIHDDQANEISAVPLKATPVAGDLLLIEDSEAGNVKKRVTAGSLGGGSEINDLSAAVTWIDVPDANVTESSVTQHEGAIDHDALLGFVAAEHVAWGTASQGTIHATNYADNLGNAFETFTTPLGTGVVADSATDTLTFTSGTGMLITGTGATDTIDFSLDLGAIDHDALLNFVTAEHVDWAGASAGTIHATNVGADHINAMSKIDAGIKRGPDATDTHLVTTDVAAPGALTCVEMDTDGSLVLAAGSCASLGPGGTTAINDLGAATGAGAVQVGANAEYGQVWTWNWPTVEVGNLDALTLRLEHDSTSGAFTQRGFVVARPDTAGTQSLETGILVTVADTNAAIVSAFEATAGTAGMIVNAFNASDPEITNALSIGDNTVMTSAGAIDSLELQQLRSLDSTTIAVENWTALSNLSGTNTGDNDEVGAVTNTNVCQGDGSLVQCTIANLADLNTALGSGLVTGAHVDASKLPLAGGTMAGDIDMGGFDLLDVGSIDMAVPGVGLVAVQTWKEEAAHGTNTLKVSGPAGGFAFDRTCNLEDDDTPYDLCVTPGGADQLGSDADRGDVIISGGAGIIATLDWAAFTDLSSGGVVDDDSHSHIVANLSDTTVTAGNLNELIAGSDTTLHTHAGGSGLWTDLVGAVVPVTVTDDVLVGSADATCSAGEVCLDAGDGSVTANSLIARPVAIPMFEFDDSDFADANKESRITADAVAANNGNIELEVEENVDGTYYEGLQLESVTGVVTLELMGNDTANFIKIAEGGVMTAEGTASIQATDFSLANDMDAAGDVTIVLADVSDVTAVIGEVNQLDTLGATTISAANWTAVAALAGLNTGDNNTGAFSYVLETPVVGDTGLLQWVAPVALTVVQISCSIDAGTASINVEERTEAAPNSAGVDALSSDLVCNTGTQTSCASGCDVNTITNGPIDASDPMALSISIGTAGHVRVHVEYTID